MHVMASSFETLMLGILFLARITITESGAVYTVSSSLHPDPSEPYITLSQFASKTFHYHDVNKTMLKFQPGVHRLDSQFMVINTSSFLMVLSDIKSSVSTDILCTNSGGFRLRYVSSVVISGLNFIGCGGNKVEFVSQLTLENSTFIGQDESQSALELVHTSSSIVKCSFVNNTAGSYRGPVNILTNVPAQYEGVSVYAWCGGALVVTNSTLNISGSVFHGNSASVGGAIFSSSSNITVIDSKYVDNFVTAKASSTPSYGGVLHSDNDQYGKANIVLINTEFISTTAMIGGSISALYSSVGSYNCSFETNFADIGGAMFGMECNLFIRQSKFEDSFAKRSAGAISLSSCNISIHTSTFTRNQGRNFGTLYMYKTIASITDSYFVSGGALEIGGVLGVVVDSTMTIQGSQFLNNSAKSASAIKADAHSDVTVINCRFGNNSALVMGGVVVCKMSHVSIKGSVFSNNTAMKNCGSLLLSESHVLISDSKFYNNTAWTSGGVLCSTMYNEIAIDNCTFINSRANLGAVIVSETESSFTILESKFFNNLAQGASGVISAVNTTVSVVRSEFKDNEATFGGSFVVSNSSFLIVDSSFSGNKALKEGGVFYATSSCSVLINGTEFHMNTALKGGVWSVYSLSNITVINGTFYGASAQDGSIGFIDFSWAFITVSQFKNCSAVTGGVLSGRHNSSVVVNGSEFFNNNANTGGVVTLQSWSKLVISNSHFTGNQAYQGGAVNVVQSSTALISQSQFKNCSADIGGVLACGFNSSTIISDSVFIDNNGSIGGVMSIQFQSNLVVKGSHCADNQASQGGVVNLHEQSSVSISDSQLNNNAADSGGVLVAQNTNTVTITNSTFAENEAKESVGGVMGLSSDSKLLIVGSQFSNNRALTGSVVYLDPHSSAVVHNSILSNNTCTASLEDDVNNVTSHFGGVFAAVGGSTMTIVGSKFVGNTSPDKPGGVLSLSNCTAVINRCYFANNEANDGGVMYLEYGSSAVMNNSVLTHNFAGVLQDHVGNLINNVSVNHGHGGVIYAIRQSNVTIFDCHFSMNQAANGGGTIQMVYNSILLIKTSLFFGNSAKFGGAIHMLANSPLSTDNCSFISNTAGLVGGAVSVYNGESQFLALISSSVFSHNFASMGVIYIMDTTAIFNGTVEFSNNSGSVYGYSGDLQFNGSMTFEYNSAMNSGENEGGAITAFHAYIQFDDGLFLFSSNTAENGGAIHLTRSNMFVRKSEIHMAFNTATNTGGSIYLFKSELQCISICAMIIMSNNVTGKGGGIHAIGSTISVYERSLLNFTENTAKEGGGLCLEVDSALYILYQNSILKSTLSTEVIFTKNSAMYGGAIHVADGTYFGTCDNKDLHGMKRLDVERNGSKGECFFQVVSSLLLTWNPNITLTSIGFTENYAGIAGHDLYGGLLDRCTPNYHAAIYYVNNSFILNSLAVSGPMYLASVSNIDDTMSSVGSAPVRICFCEYDQPDCDYQPPTKEVMKGETFHQKLIAVDHVNHTVHAVTIHASLMFKESGLGEGQLDQRTRNHCTSMNYTVYSPHPSEQLVLYANGPCKNAVYSQSRINIHFKMCGCPIGFQPVESEVTNCVCECSTELVNCISDCNQQNETLVRNSSCWITDYFSLNETASGLHYVVYQYCPYDYCFPPESRIEINLNVKYGADAQCTNHRSGTLCGICKTGFSLSLGSSQCIKCPAYWRGLTVTYLILVLLGGIVLVALLLCFNLTVAVGTLNGIIFYANIMAANGAVLSFETPNVISVFLSWMNLEMGINFCLYEGMDTYWKTWLELAFPTYVIVLVVMVVFLSEHYTKFARLIGKKNPVATLATLILLSYTKFLRTVIAIFSFAILEYPNDLLKRVWLPDATIKYLSGKHIALFITAILILLAGTVYTALLFSWQWLLLHQNKKVFYWVRNQSLRIFLEPYHAPYNFTHRYWTGLLLLIRVAIYIIISVINQSNDPSVNHLATGTVMICLLISKGLLEKSKRVYKQLVVELIEVMCYLNLSLFSIAKVYILKAKNDTNDVAMYVSGSFTLVLFLLVVVYHGITEILIKTRLWTNLKHRSRRQRNNERANHILRGYPLVDTIQEPTVSFVDRPPRDEGELPLSALVEAGLDNEIVCEPAGERSIAEHKVLEGINERSSDNDDDLEASPLINMVLNN